MRVGKCDEGGAGGRVALFRLEENPGEFTAAQLLQGPLR